MSCELSASERSQSILYIYPRPPETSASSSLPTIKLETYTATTWTCEQVATRIIAGDALFVLNGNVVRVPPSWLTPHPGGNLAILHDVGGDAMDEADADHSDETLQKMKSFVIGRVELGEDGWVPFGLPTPIR
ncbi:hypothetical protein C8T65DRAFT_656417 [Cerioporus squamosus]|nr:hypothetical protein C8T65DRAFT_656417 [Cerioporus squamosus]